MAEHLSTATNSSHSKDEYRVEKESGHGKSAYI
eukprot:CAMPEP_0119364272 /NCGR_PEP_ID=MMETSP1334-20130426/11194_1 /TAXON_ID=127549 /ORGANISM="Calcidiscus leptoporus, Strain RCC1130" /LENGTH=32 /DNA_ID= /DNA_START= /DNA_END= /DNA_ORIENTATION=